MQNTDTVHFVGIWTVKRFLLFWICTPAHWIWDEWMKLGGVLELQPFLYIDLYSGHYNIFGKLLHRCFWLVGCVQLLSVLSDLVFSLVFTLPWISCVSCGFMLLCFLPMLLVESSPGFPSCLVLFGLSLALHFLVHCLHLGGFLFASGCTPIAGNPRPVIWLIRFTRTFTPLALVYC